MTTHTMTCNRSELGCSVAPAPKQKGEPVKTGEDLEEVRKGEVGRKCPLPLKPKEKPVKDKVSPDILREKLCSLTAEKVEDFVSHNKGKRFALKKPPGAHLKIAAVQDTMYRYDPEEVNGWGQFYLPKTVTMLVIGVVEGVWFPCEELVLMLCGKDGPVYAYDEEDLHLVASSMEKLFDDGIQYPGTKTYYRGEAFKDMTAEDWEEVRKGEVGRKLDEEHDKLVAKLNFSVLKKLK